MMLLLLLAESSIVLLFTRSFFLSLFGLSSMCCIDWQSFIVVGSFTTALLGEEYPWALAASKKLSYYEEGLLFSCLFSVVAALFLVLDFFFTILCLIISRKPLISISQSLMPLDVQLGMESSSVCLEEISFIS